MERSAAMRSARAWIERGRCVILIACSARKRPGGMEWTTPAAPGVAEQLSAGERSDILRVRQTLAPLAGTAEGLDVGGHGSGARYLPACERYAGRLYERVASGLWPTHSESSVIIVSALYGLLFPWEPIQKYDLTMTSSYGHRTRVHRRWREVGLGRILAGWCAARDVVGVVDLLTKPYRAALADLVDLRTYGIEQLPFDYPGRYQASNRDRGDDLNSLLKLKRAVA
jgi:peroxide stress protein YaaA